jgi:hypothetical protein
MTDFAMEFNIQEKRRKAKEERIRNEQKSMFVYEGKIYYDNPPVEVCKHGFECTTIFICLLESVCSQDMERNGCTGCHSLTAIMHAMELYNKDVSEECWDATEVLTDEWSQTPDRPWTPPFVSSSPYEYKLYIHNGKLTLEHGDICNNPRYCKEFLKYGTCSYSHLFEEYMDLLDTRKKRCNMGENCSFKLSCKYGHTDEQREQWKNEDHEQKLMLDAKRDESFYDTDRNAQCCNYALQYCLREWQLTHTGRYESGLAKGIFDLMYKQKLNEQFEYGNRVYNKIEYTFKRLSDLDSGYIVHICEGEYEWKRCDTAFYVGSSNTSKCNILGENTYEYSTLYCVKCFDKMTKCQLYRYTYIRGGWSTAHHCYICAGCLASMGLTIHDSSICINKTLGDKYTCAQLHDFKFSSKCKACILNFKYDLTYVGNLTVTDDTGKTFKCLSVPTDQEIELDLDRICQCNVRKPRVKQLVKHLGFRYRSLYPQENKDRKNRNADNWV